MAIQMTEASGQRLQVLTSTGHRIESFGLEKTFKIKCNLQPYLPCPITKCLSVTSTHLFYPGMVTPQPPGAACSNA